MLMFLGVIIFLAGYFMVYMDYSDKTDALNTEITTLNVKLDKLKEYSANIAQYKSTIEEDRSAVNDTLSRYNSVEMPEDFIMLATDLENNLGLDISTLSFTKSLPVFTITGVKDADDYNVPLKTATLTGYKISSTIGGQMSYSQMKLALDSICSQKTVTKLDSLSINFDSSTGYIMGNFAIDKYYITGRDIQEHQAVIPFTQLGKSVLMGS